MDKLTDTIYLHLLLLIHRIRVQMIVRVITHSLLLLLFVLLVFVSTSY